MKKWPYILQIILHALAILFVLGTFLFDLITKNAIASSGYSAGLTASMTPSTFVGWPIATFVIFYSLIMITVYGIVLKKSLEHNLITLSLWGIAIILIVPNIIVLIVSIFNSTISHELYSNIQTSLSALFAVITLVFSIIGIKKSTSSRVLSR